MAHSRRDLIKGVSLGAGGFLLAPFLRQIELQAAGNDKALPQRFVFLVKSSGILPETVEPEAFKGRRSGDTLFSKPLKGVKLPAGMESLEPLKDQVSIVQGLSGKMVRGGHTSNFGMLGCFMAGGENNPGAPLWATADAELAKLNPAPFNQVGLAVHGKWGVKGMGGTMYPGISAIAANKELPYYGDPDVAFDMLFGSAASASQGGKKRFAVEKNLFDFMVADLKRVKKALPSSEKEKMDAYLHAYEQLQVRHTKLSSMKDKIKENAPEVTDKFKSTVVSVRQEAHCDIATAALIAGLTNVVTIRMDNATSHYSELGHQKGVHAIGHNDAGLGKSQDQCRADIRKHQIDLMAKIATKLKAVPEGNGTMLDNTMIMYLSDSAETHHGQLKEWPYVVVGGCGGKLKIPGRYVCYPKYGARNCRTIANWWTTLLNAHGNPIKFYGNEDLTLKQSGISHRGPLEELIV